MFEGIEFSREREREREREERKREKESVNVPLSIAILDIRHSLLGTWRPKKVLGEFLNLQIKGAEESDDIWMERKKEGD